MSEKFQANWYEINAQRYINPLYLKDEVGGYSFSSTMTFVKFKNKYFFVFAAHALSKSTNNIDHIGFLKTDGEFMPLSEVTISYEICRDKDLVVCKTIGMFEKNYFDLDASKSNTEFSKDFGWIGFPKKKAVQIIHKSKASSEKIKGFLTDGIDGRQKWNNARFLLIGVEQTLESTSEIFGHFDNSNVKYAHEGFKENGYSLKGMSGGALFRGPMKINSEPCSLSDLYDFAGIGLEYDINRKLVKGASKNSVKELLEKLL